MNNVAANELGWSAFPLPARRATIAQLSEMPSEAGAGFFADVLAAEEDAICRWYAIRAIGDLGADDRAELLLDVLRQPDVQFESSSLHLIAARSIGLLGQGMVPKVAKLLEHPQEATQIAAIDALGELRDPAAIPLLAPHLRSHSRQIRLWTALSLAKIGPAGIPCLMDAVSRGDDELVFVCVDALVMIESPVAMESLGVIAERHPVVCRRYFGSQMAPKARDYLLRLRREVDGHTPNAAAASHILRLLELD